MNCEFHPDRAAAGTCVECGKRVCPECKVAVEGKIYCNSCVERWIKPGATLIRQGTQPGYYENTSGVSNGAVPTGLGDFNWGAFLLTWIWGIGNNVYWSFLVFVPYLGALVMPWVLAFKGNELAWRSKRWDSVEHFKRVQASWTRAAFVVLVVTSFIIATVLVTGLMMVAWGLSQSGIRWF
jgi:hypothetical protein